MSVRFVSFANATNGVEHNAPIGMHGHSLSNNISCRIDICNQEIRTFQECFEHPIDVQQLLMIETRFTECFDFPAVQQSEFPESRIKPVNVCNVLSNTTRSVCIQLLQAVRNNLHQSSEIRFECIDITLRYLRHTCAATVDICSRCSSVRSSKQERSKAFRYTRHTGQHGRITTGGINRFDLIADHRECESAPFTPCLCSDKLSTGMDTRNRPTRTEIFVCGNPRTERCALARYRVTVILH